uniref:Chitin-binding type-2 domain-containing protein n=1 Tax=Timema shepardi TaxID=629360 RepID=A0A7R9FWM2_TIMSH|nr:unnamed protein product [Timema shepardi]
MRNHPHKQFLDLSSARLLKRACRPHIVIAVIRITPLAYTTHAGDDPVTSAQEGEYPTYHEVPQGLTFTCSQRQAGYYADPEAGCQKYSFLCPNGTLFNQAVRVCDWWFNVDCKTSADLYINNNDLYKDKDGNPI